MNQRYVQAAHYMDEVTSIYQRGLVLVRAEQAGDLVLVVDGTAEEREAARRAAEERDARSRSQTGQS